LCLSESVWGSILLGVADSGHIRGIEQDAVSQRKKDFVDVNLVESYDRIMAFVIKHLPDPCYLEGTTSSASGMRFSERLLRTF